MCVCVCVCFRYNPDSFEGCNAKVFLAGACFQLIFGSVAVKLFRIHRIFNSSTMQIKVLRMSTLLAICGLLVSIELIYAAVWTTMDPFELKEGKPMDNQYTVQVGIRNILSILVK